LPLNIKYRIGVGSQWQEEYFHMHGMRLKRRRRLSQIVLLLHFKACPHNAANMIITSHRQFVLDHPARNPGLAPSDFHVWNPKTGIERTIRRDKSTSTVQRNKPTYSPGTVATEDERERPLRKHKCRRLQSGSSPWTTNPSYTDMHGTQDACIRLSPATKPAEAGSAKGTIHNPNGYKTHTPIHTP
jgi:hypothetical protein